MFFWHRVSFTTVPLLASIRHVAWRLNVIVIIKCMDFIIICANLRISVTCYRGRNMSDYGVFNLKRALIQLCLKKFNWRVSNAQSRCSSKIGIR
jgi:hypothetical protein